MIRTRAYSRPFCLAGALLLAGCASYPISKEYRQKAIDVSIPAVQARPADHIGSTVIWGGIVLANNHVEDGSRLEILQMPLDYQQYPTNLSESEGRFIATTPKFLDPQIVGRGRRVTLAGTIAGLDTMPIDQADYLYPVVAVQELRYWVYSPSYAGAHGPWYDPFWNGHMYYDYQWPLHNGYQLPHGQWSEEGSSETGDEHAPPADTTEQPRDAPAGAP
jgi:outer membrane lipoprotein